MLFISLQVKKTKQRREEIQEENRDLAVKTCQLQSHFDDLKSELRQKSTEVDELRGSYLTKYEELSKCCVYGDCRRVYKSDNLINHCVSPYVCFECVYIYTYVLFW